MPDGAWWPRTHSLAHEIPELFASWSTDNGQITQLLYSPPDWDDRPATVAVAGRRAPLRTANITSDAPRTVVLVMLTGTRWSLAVIPPATATATAIRWLNEVRVDS